MGPIECEFCDEPADWRYICAKSSRICETCYVTWACGYYLAPKTRDKYANRPCPELCSASKGDDLWTPSAG